MSTHLDESYIQEQVINRLIAHLPGCFVWNHADKSGGGFPDLSCTFQERTFLIELKYQRVGIALADLIKGNQLLVCHQLAVASGGRCWVLVYQSEPDAISGCVTVWLPHMLFNRLWPALAPGDKRRLPYVYKPDEMILRPTQTLETFGAYTQPWSYAAAVNLIKDSL